MIYWTQTLFKIIALTVIGFIIPVAILLPLEYAMGEFGTRPDWHTVLERYSPSAVGCSVLFLASAITSSTPRRIVTFVQSMFLHFATLIVCAFAFMPIQHGKSAIPQTGPSDYIPFVAVLFVFVALLIAGSIPIAAPSDGAKPNADTSSETYDA